MSAQPVSSPCFVDAAERFAVEFLRPEDYDEVHELEIDCFTRANPYFKAIGMSRWSQSQFSRWLNSGWDKTGLTQIVRDRQEGNKVVAFLFCKQQALGAGLPYNLEEIIRDSPGLGVCFEHDIAFITKSNRVPRLHPTLCIETGGTREGYDGLGIAKFLRKRLVDLAPQHGFRSVRVQTISMATRHIYNNHLGFDSLGHSVQSEWQAADGTFPFRDQYQLPDGFALTCHQRLLEKPTLRHEDAVEVVGAGSEEVNGLYLRMLDSRGPDESTADCWVHATRPGTFLANTVDIRDPEQNRWTLYCDGRVSYAVRTVGVAREIPPVGPWELAPWTPEMGGAAGAAPAPAIRAARGHDEGSQHAAPGSSKAAASPAQGSNSEAVVEHPRPAVDVGGA